MVTKYFIENIFKKIFISSITFYNEYFFWNFRPSFLKNKTTILFFTVLSFRKFKEF